MWTVFILWNGRGQSRDLLFALLFHQSVSRCPQSLLGAEDFPTRYTRKVSAGGLHCCSQSTCRLSDTDFTPDPICKAIVASAAPRLMANTNIGHHLWQLATLELCGSPLFQMGKLSHILTSKDIRGIWRLLQESVGKKASCNHKTSIFSGTLKWKVLVILPLQRSNELQSHLLCTGGHSCLSHPFPVFPREGHSGPTAVLGTARRALPSPGTQPPPAHPGWQRGWREGSSSSPQGSSSSRAPFLSPDQWMRFASSWLIDLFSYL